MTKDYFVSKCDKCNQYVNPHNSALLLEEKVTGKVGWINRERHLFPENGCEGSPSRVKMLQTDAAWAAAYEQIKATEFNLIDD